MAVIYIYIYIPGCDVNQKNMDGNTPLHYASSAESPSCFDCMKILIQQKKASVIIKNQHGQVALHGACMPKVQMFVPLNLLLDR